ncbi:TIGR02556 family CRISPR-associated protein [Halanaerobium salsuginis]|jgi:CRISPR-associated protein Csh1|uniref:CRISPR-associated protein Csh1 n=1 Tax=Halanaerobium salsuginis TaxID=29563 RepID=A0A1I4M1M0_9FIRM|nr:TIGR02556 family CRISPR-associated protein [Halanaerobium salsuginis]SFL97122.1 CRISPR-associated protein Csh1 [Halanaerobium salsuginis]
MIHALKAMGDYIQTQRDESFLTQIVENPNSNGKYKTVLVILFEKNGDQISYQKIAMEEFSQKKLTKYVYVSGSPRGGDLTPTSKITKLETTYPRIQKPLKKLVDKIVKKDNLTKEETIIAQIYKLFQDEDLNKQIYQELAEISYDDNAILTIALIENGQTNYVGDFNKFTESLLGKYEKAFYFKKSYNKSERNSISKNNTCYICSKKQKKIYGYVGTFSFYTLDKPGFTTGGFNRGEAWKNYPVCSNCARTLDLGRKYLEKNLSSRFCGINYFIIPKTVLSADKEREEMFELLKSLEEKKKLSLQKDNQNSLSRAQDDLFQIMTEFNNYVNFNLMFYEEINSAFRILLYVEHVLPSYMQKIFAVKSEVDKDNIFQKLKSKEGEFALTFTFNTISDFFYINQRNKQNFTKSFLEITNNIFTGKRVSYELLINRFIAHLRDKFVNNQSYWLDNLKALQILKFLDKLDLLNQDREEKNFMPTVDSEYKKDIVNFLEEHNDVLNNNSKKLVFLEGVLAQKLLNIQSNERDGANPFRARLNGLKLNEKLVRRLYTEIINKLEEYDKNYYKQLEQLIADYILESNLSTISNSEISFYFVTGMNQANKFNFKNSEEE